jgi:acyl carrier protein
MIAHSKQPDPLLQVLIDFFDLPANTDRGEIRQEAIAGWDSVAMVQLIVELQTAFDVEFDLREIECLRSYEEIRSALVRHHKLLVRAEP